MDILVPDKSVTSFYLEDELVLFSERSSQLFYLNGTGAFIWACVEEGCKSDSIRARLCQVFGITDTQAENDYRDTVSAWEALGLLGSRGESSTRTPKGERYFDPTMELDGEEMGVCRSESIDTRIYSVLGKIIEVQYGDRSIFNLVHDVFSHLETPVHNHERTTIGIERQEDGGICIWKNRKAFSRCKDISEVVPLVHACVLLSVYTLPGSFIALHAAVVSNGGKSILMPGISGSGKSTLSASLIQSDFCFGTDEVSLVSPESGEMYSVPLSIGLKEGSWDALEFRIPGFTDLPVHERSDGQRIRYLPPAAERLSEAASTGTPIHGIVFPTYSRNVPTTLHRMSPGHVLCEIARAGYDVEGTLNSKKVSRLLDWIGRSDAYQLTYSNLDDAESCLRGLLS